MTEKDGRRAGVNATPPAISSPRAATLRGPWGLSDSDAVRVEDEYGVASEQVDRDHHLSRAGGAFSLRPSRPPGVLRRNRTDSNIPSEVSAQRRHRPPDRAAADPDCHQDHQDRQLSSGQDARPSVLSPGLERVRKAQPSTLLIEAGVRIRVQLISAEGYLFPTELRRIDSRYDDVAETWFRTPTADGFVVSKMTAWAERAAPRDLYDLWGLSEQGRITKASLDLYCRIGPSGLPPDLTMFDVVPDSAGWSASLGHQGRIQVGPEQAASAIRNRWEDVLSA